MRNKNGDKVLEFEEKIEKDSMGKDIIVGYDNNTVIMIVEKSVTERPGNPLYYFL